MNLTTATPAEIDTEIDRIENEIAGVDAQAAAAQKTIERIDAVKPGSYESFLSSYATAPERREAARKILVVTANRRADLVDEVTPLEARYAAERWNRYYLVNNSNGHVHTHMRCRTCFDTTQFVWLTEQSGRSHEDLTGDAGELSCAECFPNLPKEIMDRKTRIEDPAKRKTRLEREAAKAAREAKRLEKALLPTGEELKVSTGFHTRYHGGKEVRVEEFARFTTLASARMWLTDAYSYSTQHPSFPESAVQTVAQAVAAKEGKPVENVRAEAEKRAAKRK